MAFALEETTIAKIHEVYEAGSLTCAALVQGYFDRIAAYDQSGPKLNAIVTLNSKALDEARRLDGQFARDKKLVGPLHGIPVAIKDQAEMEGVPTSFGSAALVGYVPDADAAVVTKLKNAGAVIVAKTTMPDFAASWFGYGSVHGDTLCPYALERDSGGSSGGTGSAIGANLAAVGIGEDTGGSIRLPASANNLVGLRVTPGMISRTGLSPLLVLQDTAGPMTRTVTDAAILLDALVGYDPRDAYTTAFTIANHRGSYTRHLAADALKGTRIGVLKEAFGSDGDPDCAQVNAVIRAAIKAMESAGAEIVEISLPNVGEFVSDTSLYIAQSRYDLDTFLKSRPKLRYRSLEEIFKSGLYDRNLDLIPAMVESGPLKPQDDPDYYRKLARCAEFQRLLVGLIASNRLSAICYPCCQVLSPTVKELRADRWTVLSYPTNTTIAAQSWLPSICLPAGFSAGGVPVGLEMIAPPYREGDLLGLGFAFEQHTQWRRPPASCPEL